MRWSTLRRTLSRYPLSAVARVHQPSNKNDKIWRNNVLVLSGLKPKTRVRTRDDDCTPCEAGRRHSRHLEDLPVQELVDFREGGHVFLSFLMSLSIRESWKIISRIKYGEEREMSRCEISTLL